MTTGNRTGKAKPIQPLWLPVNPCRRATGEQAILLSSLPIEMCRIQESHPLREVKMIGESLEGTPVPTVSSTEGNVNTH